MKGGTKKRKKRRDEKRKESKEGLEKIRGGEGRDLEQINNLVFDE